MRAVLALVAAAVCIAPGPVAAGTDGFSANHTSCRVEGPDARIRFRDDALVFERDGDIVATIDPDYSLHVYGEHVALTPEQQFAVAAYRGGYNALVSEAKELGLAGAQLGTQAVFRAIGALFTGRMDEFESEIEAEAAKLEAHAAALCALAETLETQHAELVATVPEFGRAFASQP